MWNLDRANGIVGWMSGPELSYLAKTANKSTVIIEAGSFQGKSTRAMADNTSALIYAVDPWRPIPLTCGAGLTRGVGVDSSTYTRFTMNLADHIRSRRVIPCAQQFVKFEPLMVPDFIFIDAMHDYKSVKADIEHALTLMPNGILAGHDYDENTWPGVVQAVTEIFGKHVKLTDTIWSVVI